MNISTCSRIIAALLMLVFASAGALALDCPNTLRISILLDGAILIDGTKATEEVLDSRLTDLDRTDGVVWYYREGAGKEPPDAQGDVMSRVIGLVMKHRRPISLSSKPDFSDEINGGGQSSPRTKC